MEQKYSRSANALSVIVLVVILLVLLALSLWGLNSIGVINIFNDNSAPQPSAPEDIAGLLADLANKEETGNITYAALDSSVIKDVLATGKASNNYLHEYTLSYGGDSAVISCSVLRLNDDFHLLEFKNGRQTREILKQGASARIVDVRAGVQTEIPATSADFFEKMTGSVSAIDVINFLLSYREGTPVSWKLGTAKSCVAEAVREESYNMARISIGYAEHFDIYMIDMDRGVLYSYDSYVAGELAVSMRTTSFTYDVKGMEIASVLD
ncbi:MAG: hypothetical protein IKM09_00120 [Clostridia bacterium]|nr:hypothetical protein [Clostridia bacterium]